MVCATRPALAPNTSFMGVDTNLSPSTFSSPAVPSFARPPSMYTPLRYWYTKNLSPAYGKIPSSVGETPLYRPGIPSFLASWANTLAIVAL